MRQLLTSRLASRLRLLESGIKVYNISVVVLSMVNLHDRGGYGGLESVVSVREGGEGGGSGHGATLEERGGRTGEGTDHCWDLVLLVSGVVGGGRTG